MLFLDLPCRSERTVMSAYPGHTYTVQYSSADCSTVCTVQVRRERERIAVHTVQPHRREEMLREVVHLY
jgi:hypothetical protein